MHDLKRSITFKIFLITSALLALSACFIYLLFYFWLPSYYYKYKIDHLNEGANELVTAVKPLSLFEAKEILDRFSQKHNISMAIWDLDGNVVYISPAFFRVIKGVTSVEPDLDSALSSDTLETVSKPRIYTIQKTIRFQGEEYIATIRATLQPIDEVSNVIFMFMPYIGAMILLVSIIGASLYAKVIAHPLLRINQIAKRMAKLDFSRKCETDSEDEIGELSRSLNELSYNLEKTMSELKKANEQLKDDIQKEREMEAKRREFIATISHELKSPITAVKGQLEAMIHRIGVYRDRDKYLKRSFEIVQDMEKLVNEMVEISKLDMVDFSPQRKRVNLSQMLQSIIKNLEYFSQEKHLDLKNEIEEEIYVYVDEKLIRKAISNVINNAMKYSREGAQVITRLYPEGQAITLEVLNSGVHIEEKDLVNLFKPFYRVEKSRNRSTGGSGLGLFIVKRILEVHGVDYSLTNTKEGVVFVMHFPREADR
ncbi:sensor histidine kinase [Thermoflavimicrobium dichotomicum]|uniref:histidine kinase n=1 Tax=Thermoflavimicrobium dichotomicum TaxID=46223 RepID=A0A1I3NAQ4_9BACL|nr:HAMP domain-containing sensor histidine kinase [Thermoflavimicrobium dichotomicum]SFJ06227.1 two-component system, OmpR family, sensor histidine kinase VanS [Thermoflavimicrobium dichotomicum]